MSCGCIRLHSKPKEISFVLSRFLILFLIVNSCFAILLCISVMWFIVKTYKRKQVDMTKLQCIFSFLPLFILVIRTTNSSPNNLLPWDSNISFEKFSSSAFYISSVEVFSPNNWFYRSTWFSNFVWNSLFKPINTAHAIWPFTLLHFLDIYEKLRGLFDKFQWYLSNNNNSKLL